MPGLLAVVQVPGDRDWVLAAARRDRLSGRQKGPAQGRVRRARGARDGAGRRRGIGHATAVGLAAMGADVVVTGTGRAPATFPADAPRQGWRDGARTAEPVRAQGRRALPGVGDSSPAAEGQRLVEHTVPPCGRIAILVHNAAYPRGHARVPIPDWDEAVWHPGLASTLTGAFWLCKRCSGNTGARLRPPTAPPTSAGKASRKRWRWRARAGASPGMLCARGRVTPRAWTGLAGERPGSRPSSTVPWGVRPPMRRSPGASPCCAGPPRHTCRARRSTSMAAWSCGSPRAGEQRRAPSDPGPVDRGSTVPSRLATHPPHSAPSGVTTDGGPVGPCGRAVASVRPAARPCARRSPGR
jgi:NAD(P)-dependent dehydrogenase (short-subunit alcohol dehydrogenase family)